MDLHYKLIRRATATDIKLIHSIPMMYCILHHTEYKFIVHFSLNFTVILVSFPKMFWLAQQLPIKRYFQNIKHFFQELFTNYLGIKNQKGLVTNYFVNGAHCTRQAIFVFLFSWGSLVVMVTYFTNDHTIFTQWKESTLHCRYLDNGEQQPIIIPPTSTIYRDISLLTIVLVNPHPNHQVSTTQRWQGLDYWCRYRFIP